MHSNEYATVLTVGYPTPFGRFAATGASLVLAGHSVAMLVNQLPPDEHHNDRHVIETGAIEVGLLCEGVSALLAWRWKTGEGENDVCAVDTPFHIGLEHPPHRLLPLTDDGRIPMVLVTQDSQGRCVSMRHGVIGTEVSAGLIGLRQAQLTDASRANFELQHRRNVRAMMDRTPGPLAAFEAAKLHSLVAPALPATDMRH